MVSRNNNLEQNRTYDEFLKHKGAESAAVHRYIATSRSVRDKKAELSDVSQRLNTEQAPFPLSVAGIRRDWDAVQLDRLAKRDLPHFRLWDAVSLWLSRPIPV